MITKTDNSCRENRYSNIKHQLYTIILTHNYSQSLLNFYGKFISISFDLL